MKNLELITLGCVYQPPASLLATVHRDACERWSTATRMEMERAEWLWNRRPLLATPTCNAMTFLGGIVFVAIVYGFGALLFFSLLNPALWIVLLMLGCGTLIWACGVAVRWENDYAAAVLRVVLALESDQQTRCDEC